MHGTAAVLRPRLEKLTGEHPEWGAWLEIVGHALAACDDAPWNALEVQLAAHRPAGAPLLHGATLSVPARAAGRWLRAFLLDTSTAVPSLRGARLRRLDAIELLSAAVARRHAHIEAIASAHHIDGAAFGVLAHVATMPLLQRARLSAAMPEPWTHGYCPWCGAWPVFAEVVGLDRSRALRCGRCGGGWPFQWLRCAFCDEHRHDQLGSLVPEREDDARRIEKCETCRAYIKALPTLAPAEPWAVPLEDLRTVELDIAAAEHDYHRPDGDGWLLEVELTGQRARW